MTNHLPGPPLVRRVAALSGQAVEACYQCGNCSAGCPMGPWMDQLPNQLIHRLQVGQDDVDRYGAPWVCASCLACGIRCPKGIDVPRVMEALRLVTLRKGGDHFAGLRTLGDEERRRLPTIALVAHSRKSIG